MFRESSTLRLILRKAINLEGDKTMTTPPARIIKAAQYRDATYKDEVDIIAHTKHGSTLLIGVDPMADVLPKDVLKTKVWILNGKDFQVLQAHGRPMKIPGKWFEVKVLPHVKS
jgi:hypothetical protein